MKTSDPIAWLFCLGFAAVLGLPGCAGREARVQIISASISGGDATSNDRVSAQLTASDVMVLADQEIYSHLVVFECENDAVRYPASPRLGNTPMDDFRALRSALTMHAGNQAVEIQGEVLSSFLDGLTRICVKMDGGSYSGRELSSNTITVRRPL